MKSQADIIYNHIEKQKSIRFYMKKMKSLKKIFKKIVLSVFVVMLIVTLPTVKVYQDDNFERIYRAFLGDKLNFQGMIEIWNIDTFEGGKESMSSILKKVAGDFQKKNKEKGYGIG